jgi:hypothetical protein
MRAFQLLPILFIGMALHLNYSAIGQTKLNTKPVQSTNTRTEIQDVPADVKKASSPQELLQRTIVPEQIMGLGGGFRNPMIGPQDTTSIEPRESKGILNPSLNIIESNQSMGTDADPIMEKEDASTDTENPLQIPNPGSQNSMVSLPNIGVELQVNYNTNAFPPDPVAAVSGSGYIVTCTNTHVHYFNDDGDQLYESTNSNFWSSVSNTTKIYDPRIEYDTYHNRFIIVILDGSSNHVDNCQILIAVSVNSNPTNGWNFYRYSGVEGLSDRWVDYTTVGHSTNDIIIAGNIFDDSNPNNYMQTRVWQFSKSPLYSNASSFPIWQYNHVEDENDNDSFTTHPVSYPMGGYGPGAYLISRNYTSLVCWFDITEDASDDPVMYAYCESAPSRDGPDNSVNQDGTGQRLDVAGRLMNAYYGGDGEIFYSAAYLGSEDNRDKILVGRLNVTNGNVDDAGFGASGMDYAYPFIMPWATSSSVWGGGSCVTFLRTSDDSYPEFRVTHINGDFDFSNSVGIKYGQGPITDRISSDDGITNRWGDYLGGSWRENQGQPEFWAIGQYGLSTGGHGVWLAEIALEINGCTDAQACNYDPNATEDDGSCDYTTCAGCMDSEACNYDPNAELSDDFCTYPGCTSFMACNYNPFAGCMEEGSCCFGNCLQLHMPYGNLELPFTLMSYSIFLNDGDTIPVASGNNWSISTANLCLDDACYTMYTAGGNGMDWSLEQWDATSWQGITVLAEGTGPSVTPFIVGDGGGLAGCTDEMACNYDAFATCDNGGCCYENCFQIVMESSSPLGWLGAQWVIENATTGLQVLSGGMENVEGGDIYTGCLDPGCYNMFIDNSNLIYSPTLSYTLFGTDDGPIEGGTNDELGFTVAGGGPDAGCTSPTACNFDPLAVCDDGSCCFENCGELTINSSGSSLFDNPVWSLSNSETVLYSYSTPMIWLPGNTTGTFTYPICLEHGCYTIEMTTGNWMSYTSWMLDFSTHQIGGTTGFEEVFSFEAIPGCTDENACNFDAAANCDDNSCHYGFCADPTACNFVPDADCFNDSVCSYPGCTYEDAINYLESANLDDGLCIFGVNELCPGDVTGDGQVTIADILAVLSAFGVGCEDPSENAGE